MLWVSWICGAQRSSDMEWLRIGEVVSRTGLTHRTLRHYDEIGLLVPSGRTDVDYRLYSMDDLRRLLAIQHLKALGLSLTEIATALSDGTADASILLERHAVAVEARIAEEQRLLATLRQLQGSGSGWDDVLAAIELTERLRHPDPSVRFRATLTDPDQAPVDVLIDLLNDPVAGVRESATWAVSRRPGISATLVERLLGGAVESRHALAHALGKLRDPAAVEPLALLLEDLDESVAAKAAFALGQIGGAEAAAVLVAALSDDRVTVADEVTASLGRSHHAFALVTQALQSPRPEVRERAADALGLLADPASVGPLTRALADAEEPVRFAALVALGQVPTEAAEGVIVGLVESDDARLRVLARRLVADRQGR